MSNGFGYRHIFIVSAVLGIITAALLIRDRMADGRTSSDLIGPVKGKPSRFYPGQLPSPVGLTVEGAPQVPTITTPASALLARIRVARMGFRRRRR